MNKWFDSVFLPSLFERAGTNNAIWLTAKQTCICTDNMEEHTTFQNDGELTMKHKHFTYKWNGRNITLQYSSKNGCSTISFGSTAEEAEKAYKVYQAEKKSREIERLKAQKARHINHFMQKIEKIQRTIDSLKDEIRFDKEDGIETDSITFKRLEEAEQKLAFLKSI